MSQDATPPRSRAWSSRFLAEGRDDRRPPVSSLLGVGIAAAMLPTRFAPAGAGAALFEAVRAAVSDPALILALEQTGVAPVAGLMMASLALHAWTTGQNA
jgi:hypothetical protein